MDKAVAAQTMCSRSRPTVRFGIRGAATSFLDARERGIAKVVPDCFKEARKGHGRLEIRRRWITEATNWIAPRAVGLVERERHPAQGMSVERAFSLCSIPVDAKLLACAVRGHWGVENSPSTRPRPTKASRPSSSAPPPTMTSAFIRRA